VPQKQLKSQEIDYSRGKGLGGSTAINFSCWVIGPIDDFDEWAEKVGDDAWSWKNVKQRFGKIESYHVEVREGHGFVKPRVEGKFISAIGSGVRADTVQIMERVDHFI
jgi:choline dehydrogenase-like flavoprotein